MTTITTIAIIGIIVIAMGILVNKGIVGGRRAGREGRLPGRLGTRGVSRAPPIPSQTGITEMQRNKLKHVSVPTIERTVRKRIQSNIVDNHCIMPFLSPVSASASFAALLSRQRVAIRPRDSPDVAHADA